MDEKQNVTEPTWVGLRKLDPETRSFEANGQRYTAVTSLTVERYEAYELYQAEIGIGRTFEEIQGSINRAFELCNEVATGKKVFAELAVLLHDLSIGCTLVGTTQPHAVLKLCALFLVREGEDLRTIDDQLVQDKITDWKEAGIDMGYFFAFALRSIPGFLAAYRAASQSSSPKGTTGMASTQGHQSTTPNASPA
jgi:hypothetical protein